MLSVIDYSLGLTTLSQSNLLKLGKVQNEAMRVILGATKDTPIEAMHYLLDLHPWKQDIKWSKSRRISMRCRIPRIHSTMLSKKNRGVDWQEASHEWASRTINPTCVQFRRAQTSKGLGKNVQLSSSPSTRLLSENLGTHCREWPDGKTNAEIQMLVEAICKPHNIVIYTDGSVTRDQSGWEFTVKQGGRTVHEDSGVHRVTTSRLTMQTEAATCNTVASLPA